MKLSRKLNSLAILAVGAFASLFVYACKQAFASSPADTELQKGKSNTLLYKISGNGLSQPSYIFGTIHIIGKDDFFFPKTLGKSLDKCSKLVMEIDMKDLAGQISLLSLTNLPEGKTLSDFYTAEDYTTIQRVMKDSLGLDINSFTKTKPIFIQQQMLLGTVTKSGMESYELKFFLESSSRSMATGGLESTGEQMKILDSIPLEEQASMLLESIRNLTEEKNELLKMIRFYKEMNVDSLYAMTTSDNDFTEEQAGALLVNRNAKWIPLMETEMKTQPTFFAVGAAHLGGTVGVLELLRQRGYKVDAVKL